MIDTLAALRPHLAAVEAVMAEALASDEPRVTGLIADLGRFHGKMLRPTLVLLVAECLGGVRPVHHRLGAALELIHAATLIHDDLIDDAEQRRGATVAHLRFGNTTAILLGDYFYTRAFALVARLDESYDREVRLLDRLTATTNVICAGELHQQIAARDATVDEAEYRRIIDAKTAVLTALAAEFGAATGTTIQREAAAQFGRGCGIAFQIVDDCLEFNGDPEKVGKSLSTDLERGRVTLPILRAVAAAPPAEQAAVSRRLLSVTDASGVAAARAEVLARGGVASALATARNEIAEAKRHLAALPAGAARDRLENLADFIVARDF
ncbi:octaprenyl-diphosphate synthase [Planctomycetota bacterium]|nr:octaprenyl-diphosphate synthase [Planctomycetota bacterium]